MKVLLFYLKTGIEQLWKEKRCSGILILTTTVTFTAILVLWKIFFSSLGTWEEIQISQCTYNFFFREPETIQTAAQSKAALQWLTETEDLPKDPEIASLYGRTLDYNLISTWEDGTEILHAIQWEFGAVTQQDEKAVTVTTGRYFSAEEISQGENVVLLSKELCNLDHLPFQVGDLLELGERFYKIIGFVSGYNHYMPLQTILKADRMDIVFKSVCFSTKLNNTQEEALFQQFDPFCQSIENAYDAEMAEQASKIIYYFGAILLLLGICCITLIRILRYLWLSKRYEYAVYRQCGATAKQIRWILCLQIVCFTLISAILAVGIYHLFTPVLEYFYIGKDISI